MVADGDYVAIFHSVHRVMKAEKVLKQHQVAMLLIPVPRQLAADCGLAIRFTQGQQERVESVLSDADLTPAEIYRKQAGDFVLCGAK